MDTLYIGLLIRQVTDVISDTTRICINGKKVSGEWSGGRKGGLAKKARGDADRNDVM